MSSTVNVGSNCCSSRSTERNRQYSLPVDDVRRRRSVESFIIFPLCDLCQPSKKTLTPKEKQHPIIPQPSHHRDLSNITQPQHSLVLKKHNTTCLSDCSCALPKKKITCLSIALPRSPPPCRPVSGSPPS